MSNFTIITEDLLQHYDFENVLEEKIKKHLIILEAEYKAELLESLVDCESPIEQLLSLYLTNLQICFNNWNPFIDVSNFASNQKIVCENGKEYRLDFYFVVLYRNQETKYFGIECDGYEFHQKNKKQIEYDNQRQRDLQNEGIEIIRFSGSEIWKNPSKCAREVKKIILSNCKYIKAVE